MDTVCYNGAFVVPGERGFAPERLLSTNYVYQRMHAFDRRILFPDAHLEILGRAVERVCGVPFVLPESTLRQAVGALLDANRYPHGSSRITLRVFPHGLESDAEEPSWLLETAAPLYYPRYVLWHKRPLLDVFPCDCAWPGYPTSVSLLSAAFGRDAAARAGAELAVLENRDGTLTHVDDEPLFLVSAGVMFTTPLAAGATDSVMRRLVLAVCRAEKIAVCECPLTRGMLTHCEEAFTVSVQGIVSLLGYGDYRYFNLMAVKLAERINDVRL